MTTPRFSREATPDDASYVPENGTPEEDPAMEPSAEAEPDAADATTEADPADELAVDGVDEQWSRTLPCDAKPPDHPASCWAGTRLGMGGDHAHGTAARGWRDHAGSRAQHQPDHAGSRARTPRRWSRSWRS